MKAFTLDSFDTAPGLRDDLPEPEGERIVRVEASSVNPVDAAIAGGMLKGMAEYVFPVVLGRDYAGVVEGTGEEVFGFVPHADAERRCRLVGRADRHQRLRRTQARRVDHDARRARRRSRASRRSCASRRWSFRPGSAC